MNKHYIKGALVALLLSVSFGLYAQTGNVAINQNGNPPDASAILDLKSNPNMGFLMTKVNLASTTDAVTIPTPTAGMIVWNTNAALTLGVGFYYWTGTALTPNNTWLYINNSGTGSSLTGLGIAGYSAKWTSVSNLSTGVLQDNGTGVSISSTALTPVNKLDVKGNAAFGTYAGTAGPANGLVVSGNVGMGTNAPNASAALDITSTTQGLLPPRVANPALIISPATGLLVLNSTTNCLQYYTGTAWLSMACPCNTPPATPGTISGSTALCAGSSGNVYTIAAVANATSYTWTVPAGATITANTGTSITVTMGSSSGYVTVSAVNSCGTSQLSVLAITISSGIPATPAVPSGASAVAISSVSTYTTAVVAGATSYTWSVSNTNATITSGQGTTSITVNFNATPSTINICVAASNPCGTSASACLSVTSSNCLAAATLDTYVNGASATSFSITTATANEVIVIYAMGYSGPYTGSATVDGLPATFELQEEISNSSGSAVLAYFAATAGVHNIVINEAGYGGYWSNFAYAIKGNACSSLSLAKTTFSGAATNSFNTISASITTPAANCYLLCGGSSNMSVCGPTTAFSGAINAVTASNVVSGCVEGAVGDIAEPTAGTYTVANTNVPGGYTGQTIILVSVQP